MDRYGRVSAMLVIVIVAFVFVKSKIAACSGINAQLNRIGWFFGRVLNVRAKRYDGTGSDEQRECPDWG